MEREGTVMKLRVRTAGVVWALVLGSILIAGLAPAGAASQATQGLAPRASGAVGAIARAPLSGRARSSPPPFTRTLSITGTLPPSVRCLFPFQGCPVLPWMGESTLLPPLPPAPPLPHLAAHARRMPHAVVRLRPRDVLPPGTLAAPATGVITTVAGNGSPGCTTQFTTQCYGGNGGLATAAQLDLPFGVAEDSHGNLFIADTYNNVIREVVASTGIITTVAGDNNPGCTWSFPQPGACYNGDGGPATQAALNLPTDVALDRSGNLYIADSNNNVVREVLAATGIITTVAGYTSTVGFAGDGGPATQARFDEVEGITLDGQGNLYIGDTYNDRIREVVAATGIITTVAGNGSPGCTYSNTDPHCYGGDGGPATQANLNLPAHLTLDRGGNLIIADEANDRVREVMAATGLITTIAGNGSPGCSAPTKAPATGVTAARPPRQSWTSPTVWWRTRRATCSSPTTTTIGYASWWRATARCSRWRATAVRAAAGAT